MVARKRKNASIVNEEKNSNISPQEAASAAMRKRAIRKETKLVKSGIHRMTIYGAIILFLAIISGLVLNRENAAKTDLFVESSFGAFWNMICDDSNSQSFTQAWCRSGRIEPTRRTLQAAAANEEKIPRGDIIAEIPRELQIWEIDALRSDIIQEEKLLRARHKMTENPLARGAFLATYLAFERKRLLGNGNGNDKEQDDYPVVEPGPNQVKIDELRSTYFLSLPNRESLSTYHPILKNRTDLEKMLGHHSWNFAVVVMYQEMVNSEYEALVAASPLVFGKEITLEEYQTARIHVLSRSFNPGPEACSEETEKKLSKIDQERIKSDLDIQLSESIFDKGCHAMVPILDMLNSHPYPNVVYNFDSEKQAFVISAKSRISPGWELMNSYGNYSDAHLFAKYGFVNGDGSGYTQASMALFHRPLDIQISQEFTLIPNKIAFSDEDDSLSPLEKIPEFQRVDMKRYLTFDDGYDDCVQKDLHPEEFRLKQLKWMHLAKIANNPKSWIATLHPRVPESRPRKSSNLLIAKNPPQLNLRRLGLDLTNLINTCRLIVLTVHDFEGNAIKILEENLGNNTFAVPVENDALEYRSLMFLGRMASSALINYPLKLSEVYDNALKLNAESGFGGSNWTAVQLQLGEMQSLQALTSLAFSFARSLREKIETEDIPTAYKMREKSCAKDYTDILEE
mmetsp:Transcript_69/g.172  ORF Transcript_69/g.172 Transcript_69/m.172 type:complete len:683 (+) Transcript_69:147-2195(+)